MKDEKDWSTASNDELIAEAKRRYPKGTTIGNGYVLSGDFYLSIGAIRDVSNTVCVYACGKWAEVVSLPSVPPKLANPEAQKEFEENNPGMIFSKEPKGGDMVEGYRPGAFSDEWDKDQYYFTGGIAQSGLFICQDEEGNPKYFIKIRLPQKSEVESKVNEIVEYYNGPAAVEFYKPGKEREKQIALTAIKWGQQNPDKK